MLHIQNERFHTMPAAFIHYWLQVAVVIRNECTLFIFGDLCCVRRQSFDCPLQCLHHFNRCDIADGI